MAESVNGGNSSPATAAQRNVDGDAAAAGVPPDGRGDVPHALLLQVAGPAAAPRRPRRPALPASAQPRRRPPAPAAPEPQRRAGRRRPQAAAAAAGHRRRSRCRRSSSIPTCSGSPSATRARTVRSWQLKKYKGNDGKPLELVNTAAGLEYPVLALLPRPASPRPRSTGRYYQQTRRSRRPGRHLRVLRRPHHGAQDLPLPEEQLPVAGLRPKSPSTASRVPSMIEWRGGFGDLTVANPPANRAARCYFNVADNKLVEQTRQARPRTARSPRAATSPSPGIADNYFAAVFLPRTATPRCSRSRSPTPSARRSMQKPAPFAGAAVSDGAANRFRAVRRPQGHRPAQARQPQAGAGGGFRLVRRSWPSRCSWS